MVRSVVRAVVILLMLLSATPLWAAAGAEPIAPSTAVAAAWAEEAGTHEPSLRALKALYGSYAALQTFDLVSTMRARNAGAREVNPAMGGSYGRGAAVKVLLSAVAVGAVKGIEKKNRAAAFVTMLVLNGATGAIVMNNYRNAHHLAR
jgi:hypothetical protein